MASSSSSSLVLAAVLFALVNIMAQQQLVGADPAFEVFSNYDFEGTSCFIPVEGVFSTGFDVFSYNFYNPTNSAVVVLCAIDNTVVEIFNSPAQNPESPPVHYFKLYLGPQTDPGCNPSDSPSYPPSFLC